MFRFSMFAALVLTMVSFSTGQVVKGDPVVPPAPVPGGNGSVQICNQDGQPVSAITQEVGLPILLKALVDGEDVAWVVLDKGIVVEDGGFRGGDSKSARVDSNKAGTFRVMAITTKKMKIAKPAVVALTWIDAGPAPPPGPTPTPPTPTNDLTKPMSDAFALETSTTKVADAANLAKYYRSAAAIAATYTGQAKALYEQLRAEQPKWNVTDALLPATRAIVGHVFQKGMPSDPTASISSDQAKLASTTFTQAATVLESFK